MAEVICAECGSTASLVGGEVIYPHRPDLFSKWFWRCDCGAYVGCHPNSQKPLGSPVGAETRAARSAAHRAFDPLWQRKASKTGRPRGQCRSDGYAWLSRELGIEADRCHIGMMTREQALRVVDLCQQKGKR